MNCKCSAVVGVFFVLATSSCGSSKKLQSAEAKIYELNTKNAELSRMVNESNDNVANLTKQNKELASNYSTCQQETDKIYAKYKNVNDMLKDQDNIMRQMEKRLNDALGDLEDRGLTVQYKRGLVFVSMQDQLLYKSGSAKLDKNGVEALSKIATVMNDYPDVKVIVVGNTDDVQFSKGTDNWTLSTERANSVVRTLRDTYKIDPARLTSAGRGKFHPVADNSTAEGKAKNRRIEIIFNPDMDKFWDSIEL